MGRIPKWASGMDFHERANVAKAWEGCGGRKAMFPEGMDGHQQMSKGLNVASLPASDVCPYPPGSLEKIEWMRARVSRCEQTDHPDDCDSCESVKVVIRHRAYPVGSKSPLGKVAEFIYHDPLEPGDEVVIDGD